METHYAIDIAILHLDRVINEAQIAKIALETERNRLQSLHKKEQSTTVEQTKRAEFLAKHGNEKDLPRVVFIKMTQEYYDEDREDLDGYSVEAAKKKLLPFVDSKAEATKQINSLREGDILDTEGYRGTGYFYVYKNPKTKKLQLKKTQGEYGYYLPKEALSILHKFKLETADDIDQVYGDQILAINLSDEPDSEDDVYDFVNANSRSVYEGPPFKLAEHPLPK